MSIKGIFYLLKDSLTSYLWRKTINNSKINGVALMYHHITDDYVDINLSCRCPINVFVHYLDEYKQRGYDFVSLKEAYELIVSKNKTTPFCVITFDDIPDNVFKNAYPILKERNIPFAIFVTTQFVDSKDIRTNEYYITREHLHILDEDPLCTVGAHTTSHPMLKITRNSYEEMKDNKEWLEKELGHSIDYLAYPFGKYSSVSKKIQKQAKQIGFKMAFGTIEAPISDSTSKNLFYLPRMVNN